MTSSLVGSEMCIRDRHFVRLDALRGADLRPWTDQHPDVYIDTSEEYFCCLLYTSDAADDM
eukprot:7540255-Prorocentrum_lima.AAC.1